MRPSTWPRPLRVCPPRMSRIGHALDLPATVKRMQATFPTPISLEAALWVPDRGIATNISRAVGCDMMPAKRDGGLVRGAWRHDAASGRACSVPNPSGCHHGLAQRTDEAVAAEARKCFGRASLQLLKRRPFNCDKRPAINSRYSLQTSTQ